VSSEEKLSEELVGQKICADDYVLYFKLMVELKTEKITLTTFDLIEVD
jgi:hypothetical protein